MFDTSQDKFHAVGVFEKRLETLSLLAQVKEKAASIVETEGTNLFLKLFIELI